MKLALIRWRDAVKEDADAADPHQPPRARLAELQCAGFLLHEDADAVLIGMEVNDDPGLHPGRFRLHIPRVCIVEMSVQDVAKAFPSRRKKG